LSLQREAKAAGRTTAEYLRLYALEGFLLRLAHSPYRNRFVLKGGVLLAAYGLRRPTTDIDGAALQTSNDVEEIRQFVVAAASTALSAELDDGLTFDLDNVTAEAIRDEDRYGGVRIRVVARLASAREPFHVDVSIGDPIWPEPAEIWMPRLLGQEPIQLRGYSMEMVLAEKIVTAAQTPAHRDPSRTLRPDSRVAEGLRQPGHHRLYPRSGDLGSRSTHMEPRGLSGLHQQPMPVPGRPV
jgi:nucleotidyltransferase AbiEii toxin of type IV toxin-antitoxin system